MVFLTSFPTEISKVLAGNLGRKENRRLFSMLSPRPQFTVKVSDLLTFHKLVLLNLKIPKISVY